MKVFFTADKIELTLQDQSGNNIFTYQTEKYDVTADVDALARTIIKTIKSIAIDINEADKDVNKTKQKEFAPKQGETYWYIDNRVICEAQWIESSYDYIRLSDGNVFFTKQDAARVWASL